MSRIDAKAISALIEQRKAAGPEFTPYIDSPSDAVYYFILVGGDLSLASEGDSKEAVIHYMLRAPGAYMDEEALAEFIQARVNSFRVTLTRTRKQEEERSGSKFIPFTTKFVKGVRMEAGTNNVRMSWKFITNANTLEFTNMLSEVMVGGEV